MNIENVILKKDNSLIAKIIRGFLTPFSWLYIFAHFIFFIPYKLGIRKKFIAPLPVICVGNITVGGTGKTPFVITLTNILKSFGYKPVILSRGYGRKNTEKENILFMPNTALTAKDTGDEPQVLSQALNVPIIVGKNRIKSLQLIPKECNIIILDDGMQYWQLNKDLEIGIASKDRPFGSESVIPSGDLREPKKGLKRCKFIILTSNRNKQDQNTVDKIQKYCNNSFVYEGYTEPFEISQGNNKYSTDFLKGKNIFAFSGIANPYRFTDTLKSLGANIIYFKKYSDHYNYTENDLNELKELGETCDFIVTTAKDKVKLPKDFPAYSLNIYTHINEDFKNKLKEELNKIEKI